MQRLIFVHGCGGWGGMWHKQLRHFDDAEAINLPGHPEGRPRASISEYTDWLRGYVRGRAYRNVVLAGHSLGGAIALLYGLKYPEDLGGLVLVSTGARLRVPPVMMAELREAIAGKPEGLLRRLEDLFRKLPPEERDQIIPRIMDIGPRAMMSDFQACDNFDIMGTLRRILLPTLLIAGDQDFVPARFTDYLADNLPGARKVIIKSAAHFTMLEKPDEFNSVVAEFLLELEPQNGNGNRNSLPVARSRAA